jgi:hypothetical protein
LKFIELVTCLARNGVEPDSESYSDSSEDEMDVDNSKGKGPWIAQPKQPTFKSVIKLGQYLHSEYANSANTSIQEALSVTFF